MERLYEKGQIVQQSPGAVPRQKRYLDEMPGAPLKDLWTDIEPVQPEAIERQGYDTQKPEALLAFTPHSAFRIQHCALSPSAIRNPQ